MVNWLAGQCGHRGMRRRPNGPALVLALFLLLASAPIARTAAAPPTQQPPPTPPATRYWTTDWSFSNIDVNSLLSRLQSIGIAVPIEADGIVSVEFAVSVPLTRLRDGKAYRLHGKITSQRLRVQRMVLEELQADVVYRNGVMTLKPARARWSDIQGGSIASREGEFSGDVSIELLPLGNLQANLQANDIPIRSIQDLIRGTRGDIESAAGADLPRADLDRVEGTAAATRIEGLFDGIIRASVPLRSFRIIDAWDVEGRLAANGFRIGASKPVSIETGAITIRKAVLLAERLTVVSQQTPEARIDVGIAAELKGRQHFEFSLRANDVSLAAGSKAMTGSLLASGKLDLDVHGEGELTTAKFKLSGRVASPQLSIASIDLGLIEHAFEADEREFTCAPIDPFAAQSQSRVVVEGLQGEYTLTADAWTLHRLSARLLGGVIEGSGSIARKEQGVHKARLVWNGIRPQFLNLAWLPHRVTAGTAGQLDLSAPANSVTQIDGALRAQIPEVLVGDTNVGRIDIEAKFKRGTVEIVGNGRILGGDADIQLSAGDFHGRDLSGRASISALRLNEVVRLIGPARLGRLGGDVSATVEIGQATNATGPQADINLTVVDIVLNGKSLGSRLDAKLKTVGPSVVIQSVQGAYAGGRVQAVGNWAPSGAGKQIKLFFTDVDLNAGLSPWLPALHGHLDGKASGMMTLTSDQRLRLHGTISTRQCKVYGIPTGSWTSGIRAAGNNDLSRWELQLPTIQGELASGRISGDLALKSSSLRLGAADLSSRWQLDRIDFGKILGDRGGSLSSYSHGRLTGELTLGGRAIRSTQDLSGRFAARLGDTQSAAVPGLVSADRYLGLISLTNTRFTAGAMSGVIAGGTARLDELWLRGNLARVWADGNVHLNSGRIDMDVVISTGNFVFGDDHIIAFASQLAMQSVLPITGLIEVNRLLSNRTIHLAFSGSPTNPRVRPKTLEIIREEAARFLLREILVAASISSGSP
jgi:translocation and assembly module TamB